MDIKFIGLEFFNSYWDSIGNLITNKYSDYVEITKCKDFGKLYEPECHVTLYYNEECDKGPNWMYWFTTINCRDLYLELKNADSMHLYSPVMNTFDNDDSRVLKIDLRESDCDTLDLFQEYNTRISDRCGYNSQYKEYKPHLTITYLKPDTPDSIISNIKTDIEKFDLTTFKFSNILLGGGESEEYHNIKFPIK